MKATPRKPRKKTETEETTSVEHMLDQIYSEVKEFRSSPTSSKKLEEEIDEVKAQVNDQAKSITLVVASTDNLNKSLAEFLSTIKELQTENKTFQKEYQEAQLKHWHNQDVTTTQITQLLSVHDKLVDELKQVKVRQSEGCPFSLNLKAAVEKEFNHVNQAIESVKKGLDKCREEISALQQECKVIDERIHVANNRISDLEKYQTSNENWKNKLYFGLISSGFFIICSLIGIIYKGLAQ